MKKEIYFAGGCFWGVEKYFSCIQGVLETSVGYANGKTKDPSYEDVCKRGTGHAETVRVVYDDREASLEFLLSMFYQVIDPTSKNRQGPDQGTQYRAGIYYVDQEDAPTVLESLKRLQASYDKPVVVEAKPLEQFFPAEEYHQKYLEKHVGGYCHIGPQAFEKARNARMGQDEKGAGFFGSRPMKKYVKKTDEQLKKELTPLQYQVTRQSMTEPPFQNQYHDHVKEGIYVDVTTGEPLFSSGDKFDSGCGWPSFSKPLEEGLVKEADDRSHGMVRTEVRSTTGDAHLGHVFEDGPKEKGGLRYCINSAALRFVAKEDMEKEGYGHLLEEGLFP